MAYTANKAHRYQSPMCSVCGWKNATIQMANMIAILDVMLGALKHWVCVCVYIAFVSVALHDPHHIYITFRNVFLLLLRGEQQNKNIHGTSIVHQNRQRNEETTIIEFGLQFCRSATVVLCVVARLQCHHRFATGLEKK